MPILYNPIRGAIDLLYHLRHNGKYTGNSTQVKCVVYVLLNEVS